MRREIVNLGLTYAHNRDNTTSYGVKSPTQGEPSTGWGSRNQRLPVEDTVPFLDQKTVYTSITPNTQGPR